MYIYIYIYKYVDASDNTFTPDGFNENPGKRVSFSSGGNLIFAHRPLKTGEISDAQLLKKSRNEFDFTDDTEEEKQRLRNLMASFHHSKRGGSGEESAASSGHTSLPERTDIRSQTGASHPSPVPLSQPDCDPFAFGLLSGDIAMASSEHDCRVDNACEHDSQLQGAIEISEIETKVGKAFTQREKHLIVTWSKLSLTELNGILLQHKLCPEPKDKSKAIAQLLHFISR